MAGNFVHFSFELAYRYGYLQACDIVESRIITSTLCEAKSQQILCLKAISYQVLCCFCNISLNTHLLYVCCTY